MKKLASIAAAFSLAASAGTATAQEQSAPTEQQQQNAMQYLQLLIAGLQSEEIGGDVKTVLAGCLYSNSLRTISEEMDTVIAANPELNREDPAQMLGVMARICGYEPPAQPSAAPDGGR